MGMPLWMVDEFDADDGETARILRQIHRAVTRLGKRVQRRKKNKPTLMVYTPDEKHGWRAAGYAHRVIRCAWCKNWVRRYALVGAMRVCRRDTLRASRIVIQAIGDNELRVRWPGYGVSS